MKCLHTLGQFSILTMQVLLFLLFYFLFVFQCIAFVFQCQCQVLLWLWWRCFNLHSPSFCTCFCKENFAFISHTFSETISLQTVIAFLSANAWWWWSWIFVANMVAVVFYYLAYIFHTIAMLCQLFFFYLNAIMTV